MRVPSMLLPISLLALASAEKVANFNVSKAVAAQYGCEGECYANFQAGLSQDVIAYGTEFDIGFYATAANFSNAAPGDVLKLKSISPTSLKDIPAATTAYKFQYVSRDVHGRRVPATGFIAFPYASQTNDHKFRAIALAHGTSGVFRGCAPSAMSNLYEYGSWGPLLTQGYAIIATDYSGLGNNYTFHQYQASPAQANDLYYSMAAAHKLFGDMLTSEWMSVGHSQGGGAVWTLAESPVLRENPLKLGRYLGTVSEAPGVRLKELGLLALTGGTNSSDGAASASGVLGELGWVVFGLRSALPNDTQSWLTPRFRQRLELAELSQACYMSAMALVSDLSPEDVVDFTDPTFMTALDFMQNLTARGESKSYEPVLVVQGLNDTSILAPVVENAYDLACELGNEVRLQLYPGLEHDAVIPASAPFFTKWIANRFDGVPADGNCTKVEVVPFDLENMYGRDS